MDTSRFRGRYDVFYLVCFDIVDDRARQRVAKALKAYGQRVQKSVFECPALTEEGYLMLRNRLDDLIDSTVDSVRYYPLCKRCIGNVEFAGTGMGPEVEPYKIV